MLITTQHTALSSGFLNTETQLAAVIAFTIILYTITEICNTITGTVIITPGFVGDIMHDAINSPHTHLMDYTRLLATDNIIQNTVVLDCTDNPEATKTLTKVKDLEELEKSLNMLHYIIVHGEVQRLLLVKLENNGSWNILLSATIDRETSLIDAGVIRANFSREMLVLCTTCSRPLEIKCSIVIQHAEDFMVMTDPFLPCLDVLSRFTWHLGAICYGNPEIATYIRDVSNNTQQLLGFINYIIVQIHQFDTMVTAEINDDSAENTWIVMHEASQLLRYMECIYRWYHSDYTTGANATPTEFIEFF